MKTTFDKKTVMLIILDGWGYREEKLHNAIAQSKTPVFDSLWKKYPHTLLKASGNAVGLPEGQMGNSEVGHTTIGAGKPIDTDLVKIDKAITDDTFASNPAFIALFDHVTKHNSTLHVEGLLSPGGVHSHENHLFAFLRGAHLALAKNPQVKVAIHIFTDGRDTPPQSASASLKKLEALLAELDPSGTQFFIASLSGRYYAMDRDNNWDRLALVEQAMFNCRGTVCKIKPSAHLEEQYALGKNDELLPPVICENFSGASGSKTAGAPLQKNDGVFVFNFRSDRARMLTQKLMEKQKADNVYLVTLTEYSADYTAHVAFTPSSIETTLGSEIAKAGLRQTRIAETEKFPHATYFLNGGNETKNAGEEHVMLASRKDVKTHDEAPEMRAEAIADAAIEEIKKGIDFIFINFANPDMVGHTANVPAIIKAVETVDTQLGRVITALEKKGGIAFITADHGNAEVNIDPVTGTKHTAHTTNLVPAILADTTTMGKNTLHPTGGLADIAPTILDLLNIKKPSPMSGTSLIGHSNN